MNIAIVYPARIHFGEIFFVQVQDRMGLDQMALDHVGINLYISLKLIVLFVAKLCYCL